MTQEGVHDSAQDIILRSWRQNTRKQYASYLNRWNSYRREQNNSPLTSSTADILHFLATLFHSGIGYSAINTARAALSSVVVISDSHFTISAHPLISRFIKGVFQSRPALPRYSATWDVSVVLRYLISLSPISSLSLKRLSYKLLMLLLLVTGNRGQTIHQLNVDNMIKEENVYTFTFPVLLKQTKAGNAQHNIQLRAYEPDNRLCVVACLEAYLKVTEHIRPAGVSQLFISYAKPHNPVSRDTISRWVKQTLTDAGIDTKLFKPHSTRAASASAAFARATPLQTILRTAGWRTECTFSKYYNKQILPPDEYGSDILAAASVNNVQ